MKDIIQLFSAFFRRYGSRNIILTAAVAFVGIFSLPFFFYSKEYIFIDYGKLSTEWLKTGVNGVIVVFVISLFKEYFDQKKRKTQSVAFVRHYVKHIDDVLKELAKTSDLKQANKKNYSNLKLKWNLLVHHINNLPFSNLNDDIVIESLTSIFYEIHEGEIINYIDTRVNAICEGKSSKSDTSEKIKSKLIELKEYFDSMLVKLNKIYES